MDAPESKPHSYAEYLAIEDETGIKHEYAAGRVWAMAGGTIAHARLGAQIIHLLGKALDGRPCAPYSSELKIRIPERDCSYYCDASIVCGGPERDTTDRNAVVNPTVLVEVLTPSTESFDRNEKFDDYATLPSFREYVLVSTEHVRVELFRREGENAWHYERLGPGGTLRLASIDASVSVDELFAGVELDVRPKPTIVARRFTRVRSR